MLNTCQILGGFFGCFSEVQNMNALHDEHKMSLCQGY